MLSESYKYRLSLLSGIIAESMSIEDIHSKYYKDIPLEDFFTIASADPTTIKVNNEIVKKGKYVDWLIKIFKSGEMPLEDLYQATEYLSSFKELQEKNKIPKEYLDIYKYNSLPEFFEIINTYSAKKDIIEDATYKKVIEAGKKGEVRIYGTFNGFLIFSPVNQEASCEIAGNQTKWCTAATVYSNRFNHYNESGPLYVLLDIKKKANTFSDPTKMYQFHFPSSEFKDAINKQINIGGFLTQNQQVLSFFEKIKEIDYNFKLIHQILPIKDAKAIMSEPSARANFVKEKGIDWVSNYMINLKMGGSFLDAAFNDSMLLDAVINRGWSEFIKLIDIVKKSNRPDINDNIQKLLINAFDKIKTLNTSIFKLYLDKLIKSGSEGKKFAKKIIFDTDNILNAYKNSRNLIGYITILTDEQLFGSQGLKYALDKMKDDKFSKEFIAFHTISSYEVLKDYLEDLSGFI
jgi:hypothetical protein